MKQKASIKCPFPKHSNSCVTTFGDFDIHAACVNNTNSPSKKKLKAGGGPSPLAVLPDTTEGPLGGLNPLLLQSPPLS